MALRHVVDCPCLPTCQIFVTVRRPAAELLLFVKKFKMATPPFWILIWQIERLLKRKFYTTCSWVFSNCCNVSDVVQLQLLSTDIILCSSIFATGSWGKSMCVGMVYTARFLNSISGSPLKVLSVVWGDVITCRHLGLCDRLKLRYSTLRTVHVYHCAKFSDNISNTSRVIAIILFIMAAGRYIGFCCLPKMTPRHAAGCPWVAAHQIWWRYLKQRLS